MKKHFFLFICTILCLLTACSSDNVSNRASSASIDSPSNHQSVVDAGKYYRIYKESTTLKEHYEIYNANGETVLSEVTNRPLRIDMINSDIVDICIGMGTGLAIHRYYSIERNLFSEDFSYVLANFNDLIAYICIPKEHPFENRKVVVRNIFDKDMFYLEKQFDFSHVDTPVICATFTKDGTVLHLTYLSGEELTQVSETFDLKQ